MKFDDIITELGEFGPYQRRIYLLTCLAPLCVSMQILGGVFIQATPDHRCALPGLPNDTYASQGTWHDDLVNASIPWDSDEKMFDQCKLRRIPGVWTMTRCPVIDGSRTEILLRALSLLILIWSAERKTWSRTPP
ncbi:hypothetical protein RRG08_013031 [Elysia crispata]|uniref:Uncharacterized protein n=1 Tax=Elysia crispata TaxID=231223 RepID=A0AAE1A032_9GAST|nr:hypothetical protein RRG08_013031 [Elysia crispata]